MNEARRKSSIVLRLLLIFNVLTMLMAATIAGSSVALGDAVVTISNNTVTKGNTFSNILYIKGIDPSADHGLGAFAIDIGFDNTLVDFQSQNNNQDWAASGGTVQPPNDQDALGWVRVGGFVFDCTDPDYYGDSMLELNWLCEGVGSNTFTISVVTIGDCGIGYDIAYTAVNGWCTLEGEGTPTMTPEPTSEYTPTAEPSQTLTLTPTPSASQTEAPDDSGDGDVNDGGDGTDGGGIDDGNGGSTLQPTATREPTLTQTPESGEGTPSAVPTETPVTTEEPTLTPTPEPEEDGTNAGIVAGIIVGVIILGLIIFLMLRRMRGTG